MPAKKLENQRLLCQRPYTDLSTPALCLLATSLLSENPSIQGVKQHKHGRETDLRPDVTVRDEGRHHYSS